MAEEKEATLIVRLKDEASRGLSSLKANYLAVTAAIAATVAIVSSFVKSAIESENATNKLNTALKQQGIYSEALSKEMQAYASQLQRTTAFSDEAIIETQAMLTTFGLAGKSMKEATQAALDLSAKFGIDLQQASMAVGKAFNGNTMMLQRLTGITVDEAVPAANKYAEVMRQVNAQVGGSAQSQLNTFAGKVANLNNQWDDVKEKIGGPVITVLTSFLAHVQNIVNALNDWGSSMNMLKIVGLEFSKSIIAGLDFALQNIPGMGLAYKMLGIDLDAINAKLDEQIAAIARNAENEKIIDEQRLLDKAIVTNRMKQLEDKKTDAFLANWKKEMESEKKFNKERLEAGQKQEAEDLKNFETMQALRLNAVTTTLSRMSAMQSSENKKMAAVGKAAAIMMVTIDTFRAAIGARAALNPIPIVGPALGNAAYALNLAAGFAAVAQISGLNLASGGVVLPRQGGVQATIAEAGRAEAVIPLGSDRAREQMQEAGFGGGPSLTINVGTLVGSEDSVRELARIIDKELFSMRRNNESVAFEAI